MARRRGVKIAKGVRLNINKTGTSVTFSHKNLFGNTRSTTVPLTGGNRSSSTHNSGLHGTYGFNINDDGTAEFFDANGNRIYDETLIRKMKATDQFRHQKNEILERRKAERQEQFLEEQDAKYKEMQDENNSIIMIYKQCPNVISERKYRETLENIKPREYKRETFSETAPERENIEALLYHEAEENVKAPFWKKKKAIDEFVAQNLDIRYNSAINNYNNRKEEFEKSEDKKAEEMRVKYDEELERRKENIRRIMSNDEEYIEQAAEQWLNSITLTVNFEVDFEYNSDERRMYIDLNLPDIEEIPKDKPTRLANGTVKPKAKTQKEIKQDYIICVFGLALFISGNLFNVSTAINEIVISGYAKRRDEKTGDLLNDCLYSLKIPRTDLEKWNMRTQDPQQFCTSLEYNRCNITASFIMKPVEPY